MRQRHQTEVDLGSDSPVSYLRMDRIGEIECGGTFLDTLLFSFRSKDKYIALDEVIMYQVKQVKRTYIRIYKDVLDLDNPLVHLVLILLCKAVLLVCPVCCDTLFCYLMHSP